MFDTGTSRGALMNQLIEQDTFKFAGFIQNEVGSSALVLFKNLAKYCDIPHEEANKISTDPHYSELLKEKEYTGWLKEAVDTFGFYWQDHWSLVEERMDFCYDLAGIPSGTSIAASGVIMSDFDTVLPVHNDVIAYNGQDLESYGYIKYDLLSIDTLNQIQYFEGLDVDWNDVEDENVWNIFKEGDTDFVFQFASPMVRKILRDTKPNSILHLAEINALNRPGPLEMGLAEKYVHLRQGADITKELSEEEQVLYEILKEVYGEEHTGLVLFQEDVMKLCQIGAGFSLSDADHIRKAMGKKNIKAMLPYKERFIEDWSKGKVKIQGLGIFKEDHLFEIVDGKKITALELYNLVQEGNEIEIK